MRVEIYVTPICPFCHRALALLDRKGIPYTLIDVQAHPERRAEMEKRACRRTVPQIFIGGRHVGGCDDLYDLERNAELDPLLTEQNG